MIPDVAPFNNYNGNNYTTKFDYDLSIDNETQLVVLHTNSSEIQRELKLDVDYSIHGVGDENGGYIIFPLPTSSYSVLKEDEVISLYLSLPQEQQTPFGTSDKLDMNILEKTFDYIVKLIKIISRQVERSVKIPEGSKITPAELVESLKTSEVNAVKSALNASLSAQNAEENAQIAAQKANEVSKTYITAMADMTNTAGEALDDIETAREAGINSIINIKTSAIENITTLKDSAIGDITQNLDNAKAEMLNTKTEIITDLIENATNEALSTVENVKNTAINSINETLTNTQEYLNTSVGTAQNAAQIATDKANSIQSSYAEAVENILNAKETSINEIMEIKTGIVDDLVQNAAGEALQAVEKTKNSAIENINTSVQTAQTGIEETAISAKNNIDTKSAASLEEIASAKAQAIVAVTQAAGEYYPPEIEVIDEDGNCCIKIKDKDGTKITPNLKGSKGDTPVKGIDYLTSDEVNTISNEIKAKVIEDIEVKIANAGVLSKESEIIYITNSGENVINIDFETSIYQININSGTNAYISFNIPSLPAKKAITFEVLMTCKGSVSFDNSIIWVEEDVPEFSKDETYLLVFRDFGTGVIYANMQGRLL